MDARPRAIALALLVVFALALTGAALFFLDRRLRGSPPQSGASLSAPAVNRMLDDLRVVELSATSAAAFAGRFCADAGAG